ncbi:hypothetical protein ACFQ0G_03315 [Streptomyces chiangmaiensis]
MHVDVTGSQQVRERLAILSEAGTRIGSSLDIMQTGQELADLAVPLLADYATVDLVESIPMGEEPLAHIDSNGGRTPVFRRAGVASIPGAPESPWARTEKVFLPRTRPSPASCAREDPTWNRCWTPRPEPGSTATQRGPS